MVAIKVLFQKLKLALMLQCVNMLRYEQKIIHTKATAAGFELTSSPTHGDVSANCACFVAFLWISLSVHACERVLTMRKQLRTLGSTLLPPKAATSPNWRGI